MNKEFIPYEEALALKELWFDESTLFTYYRKKIGYIKNSIKGGTPPNLPFPQYVPAPLYQQAFRWFREKYGYQHNIDICLSLEDFITIKHRDIGMVYESKDTYKTYEEAEFACLKKLIEIINQTKDEVLKKG